MNKMETAQFEMYTAVLMKSEIFWDVPVDWEVPTFWRRVEPQKVINFLLVGKEHNILQDLNLQDGLYLDRILCLI
jgi:hypothetical protein